MTSKTFASAALLCFEACALTAKGTQGPSTPGSATGTAAAARRSARFTSAPDGFSESVQRLLADVSPAVVDISTDSFAQPEDGSGVKANVLSRQRREGTGVIVSANGEVITNAHVVTGAKRLVIRLRGSSV